jgi:hypothetical protein
MHKEFENMDEDKGFAADGPDRNRIPESGPGQPDAGIPQYYLPRKDGRNFFKKSVWAVVILSLMTVSFGAGMYLPAKNMVVRDMAQKEVIYLGRLTGQYSQPDKDILNQDVDFSLFWKVWDLLKKDYVDREDLTDKKLFWRLEGHGVFDWRSIYGFHGSGHRPIVPGRSGWHFRRNRRGNRHQG